MERGDRNMTNFDYLKNEPKFSSFDSLMQKYFG